MAHAVTDLQTQLITALRADAVLTSLVGEAIFDAPPRGKRPPYISIIRHDVRNRDADLSPGFIHEMTCHCRTARSSRGDVLAIAERFVEVALESDLSTSNWLVTHQHHVRTNSTIDLSTGQARAVVILKFFTEPAA